MNLHPEYEITIDGLPYAGLYEKLNTSLMAGKAAEIVTCNMKWIPAFAELGFLHPINNVWEKDVFSAGGISL